MGETSWLLFVLVCILQLIAISSFCLAYVGGWGGGSLGSYSVPVLSGPVNCSIRHPFYLLFHRSIHIPWTSHIMVFMMGLEWFICYFCVLGCTTSQQNAGVLENLTNFCWCFKYGRWSGRDGIYPLRPLPGWPILASRCWWWVWNGSFVIFV